MSHTVRKIGVQSYDHIMRMRKTKRPKTQFFASRTRATKITALRYKGPEEIRNKRKSLMVYEKESNKT